MNATITMSIGQANIVLAACVSGSHGSAERIKLKEDIRNSFKELGAEMAENGLLFCRAGVNAESITFEASRTELKAWSIGCVAGWMQESVQTRNGPAPMADGDRNLIRLSAKALKVWGMVAKQLPKVEDDEAFEVDIDDQVELDLPE